MKFLYNFARKHYSVEFFMSQTLLIEKKQVLWLNKILASLVSYSEIIKF